jgi:hypothetical protein
MTLKDLLADGRLRSHKTSIQEVADLLRVVDRDLADAGIPRLSTDRRFATAYNAALQLATITLHAAGYRASRSGHHWVTFYVLPEIMGPQTQALADYLDDCRTKRNVTDYDRAGEISRQEAEEILAQAREFRSALLAWLKRHHPALLPKEAR